MCTPPRMRAFFYVLLCTPAGLQAECRIERPLDQTIPEYEAEPRSLTVHIHNLSRLTQVCFGVEAIAPTMIAPVEKLILRNVTLGQALSKLLAGLPGVRVEEAGGVVLIRPRTPQRHDWLDESIGKFQSRRDSLQTISNLLFMTLAVQADPGVRGFAGSYPPGDTTDLVGPFHEENQSLRKLLNLLLLNSKGGIWVTDAISQYRADIPRQPFWVFQQYQRQTSDPDE